MLGHADPLLLTLDASDYEGKLYVFTDAAGSWPTVENVASVIATLASGALAQVDHANNAWVSRVDVRETSVNGASWIGPGA
jgi:hypothetical protein